MLIIFISPNVIARPKAINKRMELRLTPLNSCVTIIDKDVSSFSMRILLGTID
jgi:hypothetical protein